jgi:putative salt-induced outer membrane protein YdiY
MKVRSRAASPRRFKLFSGALVALLLASGPAHSDVVYMKNGDKVTGDILQIESDNIHVDSDVADEIEVDLADVESIETTQAVEIELNDGSGITGFIVRDADGKMWVRPAERGQKVDAPLVATDADRSGVPFDLSLVHHVEEAKTYFNYDAKVDVGLNAATGNTDTTSLAVSGRFRPSFGKNDFIFKGQFNRADSDGDKTASNWRLDNTYERELTQKWFANSLLAFENDDLQDLKLRTTAGAGVGYKFFEPSPTGLKVSLGPAYIDENYEGSDDDRDYVAALWMLDFIQDLYTDDVQFYHEHRASAGLSEKGVLVLTTTGLKFDLISDLKLLLEVQFDWNSEPSDGADETDQRYLVKLGYEFDGDQNDWFQ